MDLERVGYGEEGPLVVCFSFFLAVIFPEGGTGWDAILRSGYQKGGQPYLRSAYFQVPSYLPQGMGSAKVHFMCNPPTEHLPVFVLLTPPSLTPYIPSLVAHWT